MLIVVFVVLIKTAGEDIIYSKNTDRARGECNCVHTRRREGNQCAVGVKLRLLYSSALGVNMSAKGTNQGVSLFKILWVSDSGSI